MTITYLPETDVLSAEVNPLLDEVATLTPEEAELVEFGATTVIQMLKQSAHDLREATGATALLLGQDADEAKDNFTLIYNTLSEGFFTPRTEALRSAVEAAYAAEEEDEEEQDEDAAEVEAIDDLLEGLFGQMFGAEFAAGVRERVEASRAAA